MRSPALFGGLLLWAVAGSLVGQVYLLGLSLVYLRVTEGLDLSASEAALRAAFEDAKRRTAELGGRRARGPRRRRCRRGAAGVRAQRQRFLATDHSADDARATTPPCGAARAIPTAAGQRRRHRHRPAARRRTTFGDAARRLARRPGLAAAAPRTRRSPARCPPAPPLPAITTCPQCLSSVAPEDTFCGVCGYRLK